jgi:hypothetical protein
MGRSKRTSTTSKQAKGAQAVPPQAAAARNRISQRRRQRIMRQMRKLESVLPEGAMRPRGVPRVDVGPVWRVLGSWWLWVAVTVVVVAGALLVWVHSDERFFLYTEDAQFNGLTYLDRDELWKASEIDGWNVFWLDTAAVRERLLQNPYVEDASIGVAPLVGRVVVDITEAKPVALWVTGADAKLWLLKNGRAVEPRGAMPAGLLEITDPGATATAPGAVLGAAINPEVLVSAQGLIARLPKVAQLRYNRQVGLNFLLPDKPYWVYWGDGADVERKLENLAGGLKLLADGETKATVIDVRFARPYVK